MTDMFTGMPFYWQGPGPMAPVTGPDPFSAKISAQQANQQNQMAGWNADAARMTANLNQDPARYAGIGAAYGRATGGFGLLPSGAQAPAGRVGTISNPGTSNPGYLDFGGGADQAWVTGGSQGPRPSSGGIGSDAARAPNQPAIQSNIPWGGYNAPRTYGWDANEGAPAPAAPQVFNRGEFNPHTYGWDHNEGAPAPAPQARSIFNTGTTPFNNYMGGANPGGFSPSPNYTGGTMAHGGAEDQAWVQGGSQGPRPSDVQSAPKSPLTGLGFGGNRDALASLMMRNASPQAPAFPVGQGIGKADRLPLFQGGVKAFGGQEDQDWVTGGSQGARPSSGLTYGGSEDQAWVQGGSQGDRPSTSQGIGSDMLRGNQNQPYAQPWHGLIPSGTPNTPEIIKQINYTAGRNRQDPAALAGVVNTESRWDPTRNFNSFFGATQMGPKTFKEAGGTLDGMNFNQYKAAPLERQIPAYGDWLAHYARPNNAAGLATSDIRSYPVPMQAAIMQGAQFAPNATSWPAAFARGDTSMQTTPSRQADFLSPLTQGWKPTLNTMNSYYGRAIPR